MLFWWNSQSLSFVFSTFSLVYVLALDIPGTFSGKTTSASVLPVCGTTRRLDNCFYSHVNCNHFASSCCVAANLSGYSYHIDYCYRSPYGTSRKDPIADTGNLNSYDSFSNCSHYSCYISRNFDSCC